MADNVAITAGAGTTIATDDDGTAHHQYVKVEFGPDNTQTKAGLDNPLPVLASVQRVVFDIDIPGVVSAAYAAGDQYGTLITITGAARATGGSGTIDSITLYDDDIQMGSIEVYIYDSTVTLALDNAAYAVSDGDNRKACGPPIQITYTVSNANNRVGGVKNLGYDYVCSGGTSLFAAVRTLTTPTPTAASKQRLRFTLTRD